MWPNRHLEEPTTSTDSLILGGAAKGIDRNMLEIGRVAVPVGKGTGWVSIFFLFRTVNRKNRLSHLKLSLRKYQWYKGGWKRRGTYNVNSDAELKAIYDLIAAHFPHVLPDVDAFQAEDLGEAVS